MSFLFKHENGPRDQDAVNGAMVKLKFATTPSIDNDQDENKRALLKQNKYCEEQIIKCDFELLLANSQYIKSVQPKKYVESLLEAAKAAAVAFKMTRRKTPYGKYLLFKSYMNLYRLGYYNCLRVSKGFQ